MIHGWKGRYFFVTFEKPWGVEALWQAPKTDLNSPVGLGEEEAENLTHLLECAYSAFELLEEETLVNPGLSRVEPEGNSLWTFNMVI